MQHESSSWLECPECDVRPGHLPYILQVEHHFQSSSPQVGTIVLLIELSFFFKIYMFGAFYKAYVYVWLYVDRIVEK